MREAVVTTLIFAGPRAHELGAMLERDIDLANGRIMVGRSKTAAGLREIRILPILHDVLAAHKARPGGGDPDALAFPTEDGTPAPRTTSRPGSSPRCYSAPTGSCASAASCR